MTNIIWTIVKFILKFTGFALVFTYLGKFFGLIYLVIWIILSFRSRNKRKHLNR